MRDRKVRTSVFDEETVDVCPPLEHRRALANSLSFGDLLFDCERDIETSREDVDHRELRARSCRRHYQLHRAHLEWLLRGEQLAS